MAENIHNLLINIEKIRISSPMAAPKVTVLGACKGQGQETILTAARGISDFGENRVQEAQDKWTELKGKIPGLRLHLIGPLQTNKVVAAVALFDVIQTVDREKLVDALAEEGWAGECYVQVNTGEEPQKAGVSPAGAAALVAYAKEKGLKVVGLMCVPPVDQHPAPHFALLKQLADSLGVSQLSMGMSDDYETAIRMGSTCVRLGRVLFGERPKPEAA